MALPVGAAWEARSGGASTNGGGFNVGNANFATDLAATTATGVPVVTSASYNFVAGDVNAFVFIKSGTNWIPGWYQIASVASNAATLTATIGSANLYGGATVLNTATGCATAASPTGGTWGVDYSQQNSAQISWTDTVIGATTTQFTSAANPVTKAMTGNIIQQTSGSGFTTGWFEIVSTSGTTATCDRSLGTTASTAGHATLGGALDGIGTLSSAMIASNWAFIQTTSGYSRTASATFSQACTPSNSVPYSRLIGYTTYRGDNGRAAITLSTNTGLTALIMSGSGWKVENLSINCASLGTSIGITASANYGQIRNCKIANFTTKGISVTTNQVIVDFCEVTGGTAAATSAIALSVSQVGVTNCWVHDNVCPGIVASNGVFVMDCLITNNTGASSDGIQCQYTSTILGNTIYNSGRHGISNTVAFVVALEIRNNILSQNGGYGLVTSSSTGTPLTPFLDGNAYYSNTSGTRNNGDDLGTTNPIDGIAPYVTTKDVILSADPFVAKASDDYRLNTTASGGAACRGFGVPQTWPGNTLTVSSLDMGVSQHADPAATFVGNPFPG